MRDLLTDIAALLAMAAFLFTCAIYLGAVQ